MLESRRASSALRHLPYPPSSIPALYLASSAGWGSHHSNYHSKKHARQGRRSALPTAVIPICTTTVASPSRAAANHPRTTPAFVRTCPPTGRVRHPGSSSNKGMVDPLLLLPACLVLAILYLAGYPVRLTRPVCLKKPLRYAELLSVAPTASVVNPYAEPR